MRRLLFVIISVLLLFSCATKRSYREGQPRWTYEIEEVPASRVFVASGSSSTNDGARDVAYNNLLSEIGSAVGLNLGSYFRELVQRDEASEIGLRIDNYYLYDENGEHEVWVRGLLSNSSYESLRSEGILSQEERTSSIGSLLSAALSDYRENRDGSALTLIMQALSLSLDGPVTNSDYEPDKLLKRAMEYLDNIFLRLYRPSSEMMETMVEAKRRKGVFYPVVENLLIRASYDMENEMGEIVQSSFLAKTNNEGLLRFNKTNPYMVREGDVVFSVYIDPALINAIQSKAERGFLDEFMSLLDSKSIVYSYVDRGILDLEEAIVALSEYDEEGNSLESELFIDEFRSYLERVDVRNMEIVYLAGEEEEDILSQLEIDFPNKRYYIIGRIGLVDSFVGPVLSYAMTQGSLSIYERGNDEPYVNQESFTSSYGNTLEEAEIKALSRESRILAGRLLEEI